MATGFPLKVTYADGDVYSASDVNDTNGTINLLQTSTLSRSAGKNGVINGAMEVWQRGTSGTANGAAAGTGYNCDRWQNYSVNALTVSRQTTGDTTNLPNIQYCARVQRNSGQTSTSAIYHTQTFENINSIPFSGKTITYSFYARAGANYSSASSALTVDMRYGTGTDQNMLAGFTGATTIISQAVTLTTTWQRFSVTATVAAAATQIGLGVYYVPVGTAGANDYFEITGVQLELGSYATTFSRSMGTYQGELAGCQRYFQITSGTSEAVFNTNYYTTTNAYGVFHLKVTMRAAPTLTASATTAVKVLAGGVEKASSAITIGTATVDQVEFTVTTTASTTGYAGWTRFNGAGSYLQLASEL